MNERVIVVLRLGNSLAHIEVDRSRLAANMREGNFAARRDNVRPGLIGKIYDTNGNLLETIVSNDKAAVINTYTQEKCPL